jgi:hypothetical protein
MEQVTHTIWRRLLTKRQRSSLSSLPDSSKTSVSFDGQGKNFFFNNTLDEPILIDSEPHKKVKLEKDFSGQTQIDSPSTRIDENSPNLIACISPQIKFNEVILGSPATYELDRESSEDIEIENVELPHQENESLKQLYELNKEIKQIMEKKQGKVMMEKEIYHETYFFLAQCSFNHIWETNLEKLRKNDWCEKCLEKFKKCVQFAEKKNWTLINKIFLFDLTFQCPLGHQITATAKNYEHKISCADCKKIARQIHLEHLKEEEDKAFQERLKAQERLFEESRRKSCEENKVEKEVNCLPILEAYKQINMEIEPLAMKYSCDYIEKKGTDKNNLNKYLEVYKILLVPDDIFKLYLNSLNVETLKREYRFLAKSIHPDKNNHPKAGNAFQKLNKLYEEALKKEQFCN